jgi:terminase small subunit / prophage DNA-packing protein
LATQAEVAAHLFLSQPEVSKHLARGVLPKPEKRGGLDLNACREAYIKHLREVAAGRASHRVLVDLDGEKVPLDLVTERARLTSEQADGQAMKNAMMRRELIPKPDVVAGIQTVLVRFRAKMLALPTKAAPLIIGMTALTEVVEKLTELVHEALDELANLRFVPDGPGGVDGVGADGRGEGPKSRLRS